MRDLTVTAIGKDRPGIIAAVTKVFFDLGCNLADCSMTRLSEQFAMILLIEAPEEVSEERLRAVLEGPATQFGLAVNVVQAAHSPTKAAERPFVISLYGGDRPGIVFRVTTELARRGINVTDLVSRVVHENIYLMVLEVDLLPDLDEDALRAELERLADDLDVDLTLRPAEAAEL